MLSSSILVPLQLSSVGMLACAASGDCIGHSIPIDGDGLPGSWSLKGPS